MSTVFLINRLPNSILANYKSPFEKLFHKTPDYKFLKPFGCSYYPCLMPDHSHKLSFRTSKCIFIGYSPLHKGYRYLHPSSKVHIAKSVLFDEHPFHLSCFVLLTQSSLHSLNLLICTLIHLCCLILQQQLLSLIQILHTTSLQKITLVQLFLVLNSHFIQVLHHQILFII